MIRGGLGAAPIPVVESDTRACRHANGAHKKNPNGSVPMFLLRSRPCTMALAGGALAALGGDRGGEKGRFALHERGTNARPVDEPPPAAAHELMMRRRING